MVDFVYPENRYICYIDTANIQNPVFKCQSVGNVLLYGGVAVVVLYLLMRK